MGNERSVRRVWTLGVLTLVAIAGGCSTVSGRSTAGTGYAQAPPGSTRAAASQPVLGLDIDEFLANLIAPRDEHSAWEGPPVPGVNLWVKPGQDGEPAVGVGIRLRYCWKVEGSHGVPNPWPKPNWYGPQTQRITAAATRDAVESLARAIDKALDKSPASPAAG
jgi:hypothetical protein